MYNMMLKVWKNSMMISKRFFSAPAISGMQLLYMLANDYKLETKKNTKEEKVNISKL